MTRYQLDNQYSLSKLTDVMTSGSIKEEALRLIETLADDSTWDDLMYKIYVRKNIEAGLADSEAGRVVTVDEVRKSFGLPD
jgi:hypothetical protein